MRERMEEHRANEPCNSCHKLMDPIGLALENFDGVGGWRANDSGHPRLTPKARCLTEPDWMESGASLRQAILNHTDSFVRAAFTGKSARIRSRQGYRLPLYAGGPRHRTRCGERVTTNLLRICFGHRKEPAISDEHTMEETTSSSVVKPGTSLNQVPVVAIAAALT